MDQVFWMELGYLPKPITSSSDNQVVNPAANTVWDITVGDSVVTLTDSNGVTIAPKGGNNNGIQSGAIAGALPALKQGPSSLLDMARTR